ncbi:hypothetical protein ACFQT4_18085 [Pseudoduganella danionis]|uniref:hypothetical protein n=1 Tax=Pseudoduganella danionis TaxID=1890295 RepID=UPI00360E4D32
MPAHFDLQQFQAMTPLDGDNIWAYLLDHHAERITVKRRKPALENIEKIFRATFKLANEVGFRTMNLRDLCRETGLSMGAVWLHQQQGPAGGNDRRCGAPCYP